MERGKEGDGGWEGKRKGEDWEDVGQWEGEVERVEGQRKATRESKGEGGKGKEQVAVHNWRNVERYIETEQLHKATWWRNQTLTKKEPIPNPIIRWCPQIAKLLTLTPKILTLNNKTYVNRPNKKKNVDRTNKINVLKWKIN